MWTRRSFLATSVLSLFAADSRYRIGITTNTIGGWEQDPFVGFREARAVGYRFVESFVHYFPTYYPDKPQALMDRLKEIGVGLVTLSNGGTMTESHFEDPTRREKIIADHLRLAHYIKPFGCTHLKINLGPRRPTGTTNEDLKNMALTLDELGRRVRLETGLKFAPHAHMWSQFENSHEIDYVLHNTKPEHVYFVLDTGHITMAGIDPVKLAKVLGHRIVEFHMKDTKPEVRGGAKERIDRPDMKKDPPFFPLGKGGVDFEGLKAHLDSIQWKGWLTVELDSSPFQSPKQSAKLSYDYLTGKLGIPN